MTDRIKVAAAVIVRNELARYLEPCVGHLLEFVDQVVILDDCSTDGWQEALRGAWGKDGRRVIAKDRCVDARNSESAFYRHAAARQALLEFTLTQNPSHVLAVDADEFVSDGQAVRAACEKPGDLFSLKVEEIWAADQRRLYSREDGGWRGHEIGILWRPARFRRQRLTITDRGHATGRVPELVNRTKPQKTGASLLHFGWANRAERDERYARYRDGDGGKFHASSHIASIMWPDRRVRLKAREWPPGLDRPAILERATRKVAA